MLGNCIEPGDYSSLFEIYPGGYEDWLSYIFGGDPTTVISTFMRGTMMFFLKVISAMILPLLSDSFVNYYFLPILQFIMTLSGCWIVGFIGIGLCFMVRILFTLDAVTRPPKPREWGGNTPKKPTRLKPKPNQRLSGKKWRAMMRWRRRYLMADKTEAEQRRLSGRVYFDRAVHTKLERVRRKLRERALIKLRELAKKQADNPGWDEAMSGPEAAEFWKAAELEIATLEKMKSWEVVDRSSESLEETGTGRGRLSKSKISSPSWSLQYLAHFRL